MKYPLELIEWYDAESETAWESPSVVKKWGRKSYLVIEVGFIVAETKEHIIIANQISANGDIGNRTRIPKPWFKSRRKLDYGGERTNGDSSSSGGKDTQADGEDSGT